MDEMVRAAMAKWPNVPAVYGWLRLDARGQWWLREERLLQPAITDFFRRNYARDGEGRFYVQNGPQKVYVTLEAAPFIARRLSQGWQLVPDLDAERPRLAYLDAAGSLYIEIGGEAAVVDDRDLLALAECIVTPAGGLPDDSDWQAWQRGELRLHLDLPEGSLRLKPLPEGGVAGSYGVVLQPAP